MGVEAVPKIATRNPERNSTKVQLHISLSGELARVGHLIDFSEARLRKLLKMTYTVEKRQAIIELLERYVTGKVAIGWKSGLPLVSDVIKDA